MSFPLINGETHHSECPPGPPPSETVPSVAPSLSSVAPSSLPAALRAIMHEHPVDIGANRYSLLYVNNIDALLDTLAGDAEVPYWAVLWESSIALSGWLVEHPDIVAGKDILELGAGLGLCGMVARQLGARVVQTDNHQPALDVSAENARRNGIDVPDQFLGDWRDWTHDRLYDVVIGSDIVYERPVHEVLLPLFRRNLKPGGLLLLADPFRETGWEMAEKLEKSGWTVDLQSRLVAWEKKTTEILMLHARRAV